MHFRNSHEENKILDKQSFCLETQYSGKHMYNSLTFLRQVFTSCITFFKILLHVLIANYLIIYSNSIYICYICYIVFSIKIQLTGTKACDFFVFDFSFIFSSLALVSAYHYTCKNTGELPKHECAFIISLVAICLF